MSHWALLGIPPTQDKGAIRRAYARRLKALRLDREADAFQNLLAARARALQEADHPSLPIEDARGEPDGAETDHILGRADPPIEAENGQRARVVETDLLEHEVGPRPLLGGGKIGAGKLAHLEARLTMCLAPLERPGETVDMVLLDAILHRIADLPLGSRRDAERFCLIQLASRLKRSDDTFDPIRALRVRPILLACDHLLGWSVSDDLVLDTLDARDANTVTLMLDARDSEPSSMKLAPAARLRRFDAQVLLEETPRLFSLYKTVVAGGALPWHCDPWCVPAPYIWAFRRRYWAISVAWYMAGAGASALAFASRGSAGDLVTLSAALTVIVCFAGGFLADRMVFLQSWRIARKADRRGLFDAVERKAFLRKRNAKVNGVLLFYFVFMLFWVSLFPYFGLLRAFRLLP